MDSHSMAVDSQTHDMGKTFLLQIGRSDGE